MKYVSMMALVMTGFFVYAGRQPTDDAGQAQSKLAGATPVVEAIGFPSLQAAIDALPESGGKVVLPAGRFEISAPLRIDTSDTCIEGVGSATHIHNVNPNGEPAFIVAHPEHKLDGNDREHELDRVQFKNLRLTGQGKSGVGVAAHNINFIFLHGVSVTQHGGDGILLSFCYEDPRVSDCIITYNGQTGLKLVGCHDIVVSANHFEENQDALHCLDGFNLCMTGNCLDDHLGRGVVIENTYGSVVSGNMIEECQGPAIVLDRDCYGICLSANVIAHNGSGIELHDAHGCTVSANTLTINRERSLFVGPKSGRIAFAGNSVSDSYIGDGLKRAEGDRQAAGVVLDSTEAIGVTGNVFSGLSTPALDVKGEETHRLLIGGNVFEEVAGGAPRAEESLIGENLEP